VSNILIVEDEAHLVDGLSFNLQREGHDITVARDGTSADRFLADSSLSFDLVLLDLMLPGMGGFEVARRARAAGNFVPILILTAKDAQGDLIRGIEEGADDYLTKPFSIRELMARANAFIRRRGAGPASVHRFGECELDLESHRLYRRGAEVALTPKEFQLLEYFVQRTGRALTRDDIMDSVWGSSVIVTARSVDRCVTTLRGKIEPEPRHPTHIQTIRDIGYRFEADAPAPKASSPGPIGHGKDDDFVALRLEVLHTRLRGEPRPHVEPLVGALRRSLRLFVADTVVVFLVGDDVEGLEAEGLGAAHHRADVARVEEPLDHRRDGGGALGQHGLDAGAAGLGKVRLQHRDDLRRGASLSGEGERFRFAERGLRRGQQASHLLSRFEGRIGHCHPGMF